MRNVLTVIVGKRDRIA